MLKLKLWSTSNAKRYHLFLALKILGNFCNLEIKGSHKITHKYKNNNSQSIICDRRGNEIFYHKL